MKFVPATSELISQFYGSKMTPTMRAYVVLDDDEVPISVGGFIRMSNGRMALFNDSKEGELAKHKVTAMKFAKWLIGIADAHHWRLIADPDVNIPGAKRFLTRLGFKENDNGVFERCSI